MTFVIEEIFRSADARIVEIFLENYDEVLTIVDIMTMTDVNYEDTKSCLRNLESKEIITKVRNNVYKFNTDNYLSKALIRFEHEIVSKILEKKIREERWKK